MMRAIVLSLGLAGFLVGAAACGGDDMVADAQKLVDETCACKDQACLDKVEAKGDEMKKKYGDKKPSDEQMKKLMELGKKAMDCEAKIKGEAGGEAAPQ